MSPFHACAWASLLGVYSRTWAKFCATIMGNTLRQSNAAVRVPKLAFILVMSFYNSPVNFEEKQGISTGKFAVDTVIL